MQEHLEADYHSAWHAWRVDDAAMLNKGTSRWTNYYIEGLAWLAENQKIDGLYLDDIYYGVIPFIVLQAIVLGILVIFPEWFPGGSVAPPRSS